jgi:hypothetical protein
MMPIVSSVSVLGCIPAGANMLKLGLKPTTRGTERGIGGDVGPSPHHRLAVADAFEAAVDDGLGGKAAGLDAAGQLGGG